MHASPDLSVFVRGNYYEESRDNGTRPQFNNTDAGSFATGARARTDDGSEWTGTVFTDFQSFHSTFSTQAADRNSETLALDQRVPSTAVGAALTGVAPSGPPDPGRTDFRWIEGETDERIYVAGAFSRTRVAGGQQQLYGLFLEDVYTPSRSSRSWAASAATTGAPTTSSGAIPRRPRASPRVRPSPTSTAWA